MVYIRSMIEKKKAAGVLVFNDVGELALQLRSAHDDKFPGYWDISACGGIDPNEDSQAAAERELLEEIGVKAKVEFLAEEICTYPGWDPTITRETDLFLYRAQHNGPFVIDSSEVERVEFFKLEKIKEMMEIGVKFHPEFILIWDKGLVARHSAN